MKKKTAFRIDEIIPSATIWGDDFWEKRSNFIKNNFIYRK
jgi:hypothetical protein